MKEQSRPKTCATCAHCAGWPISLSKCMKSGFYAEVERKYPKVCDEDFSGWVERESIFRRVKAWIVGV